MEMVGLSYALNLSVTDCDLQKRDHDSVIADNPATFRLGIIVLPNFSLMSFTCSVEPLRSANYLNGEKLFDWCFLSVDGGAVRSSCGVQVVTERFQAHKATRFSLVLVIGGVGSEAFWAPEIPTFLRRVERHGGMTGAVSTGSFLMARAGLLESKRCTIHWESQEAFREVFPNLEFVSALYVIDGRTVTCAGGTAVIDLMLHMVGRHGGASLSSAVSDQFIHGLHREAGDAQRMGARDRLQSTNPIVLNAVQLMESEGDPLSCKEIARLCGTSMRNLERLFQLNFSKTPRQYYMSIRLERARRLLRHTVLSVTKVAMACGFDSVSYFSKCYSRFFGVSPRNDRRRSTPAASQMVLPGS